VKQHGDGTRPVLREARHRWQLDADAIEHAQAEHGVERGHDDHEARQRARDRRDLAAHPGKPRQRHHADAHPPQHPGTRRDHVIVCLKKQRDR
jgi:hypothetical protein